MQLQKIRTPFVSTHIDHRALFIYMYVCMYAVDLFVFTMSYNEINRRRIDNSAINMHWIGGK